MSATSLFVVAAISLIAGTLPISGHKLITGSYPDNEWEIIVSSDPIRIRERKQNDTTKSLKLNQVLQPQKRSFTDCPENDFPCLYGNEDDKTSYPLIEKFVKRYSNIEEIKYDSGEAGEGNVTDPNENRNPGKSYWNMVNSQAHHHPYDDKNGWVTLEPIPWSSSKISKWHPKVEIHEMGRPWNHAPTTERPVHQFWVSGSSFKPQRPNTHWGIGSNDIITDSRPSGFPTGNFHGYSQQGSLSHNTFYGFTSPYQDIQQNHKLPDNFPPRYPQNSHPSTYPSHGNGEWVLLSTKKGYSQPRKWTGKSDISKADERAFSSRQMNVVNISRYHEEDLNEKFLLAGGNSSTNRKSSQNHDDGGDSKGEGDDKNSLHILYTGSIRDEEPTKTIRRKVRLQVLPALENTSTSYGGLLEVDSNPQTVDEALEEDKIKKLKAIANVKKNKLRGFKLVPASAINDSGIGQKKALTLAAVGAGMIPATMAILLPMAFGRSRRSVSDSHRRQNTDKYGRSRI